MKKKTLVLTENFPPLSGGSGRWFWELYSRLPNDEYLIVADDTLPDNQFDKSHSINVIRIPLNSNEWGVKSWTGLKFYFRCLIKLIKIIKQHKITHIHAGRVIHEGVTAYLLKFFTGVDYLCYVHGEDVETAATSGEYNLMVKQVCKRAAVLICNSENSANIVKRLGYAKDDKIRVLNPGVDTSKFVPAKEDLQFKSKMGWENKKVILTVGRLQQRKGHDKMIAALPQVLKEHPDTLYAIVGRGECLIELQSFINKLNLNKHVQLLDEISDEIMIKCYQQCDLFILPNRTIGNDIEGFGMVLVEAQACAKPVIAGDSGGTKETMIINETGVIIDCTDPKSIAGQINSMFQHPKELISMGAKGRSHVENELTWQAHVKKSQQIFEQP